MSPMLPASISNSYSYQSYQRQRQLTLGDLLLENRIVFLQGEIYTANANEVVMKLLYLQSENRRKDIHFYLNSPGGDVVSTLAIYDTMQILSCPVATYCVGQAASGAAVLLTGGTKGKRFALPHARVMLHQPYGGVGGQVSDIEIQANEILRNREMLNEILAVTFGPGYREDRQGHRSRFLPERRRGQGLRLGGRDPQKAAPSRVKTRTKRQIVVPRRVYYGANASDATDSLRCREERPRRARLRYLQSPAQGPHRFSRLRASTTRWPIRIVAQMLFLQSDDPKADIHFYINSPGGSVSAGLAIYDTMQFVTCDVATYCIGQAASMGAVLLTAGADRQTVRAAQRPDHDPPAAGRHAGNGRGDHDPRQGVSPNQGSHERDPDSPHRSPAGQDRKGHRSRLLHDRRRSREYHLIDKVVDQMEKPKS